MKNKDNYLSITKLLHAQNDAISEAKFPSFKYEEDRNHDRKAILKKFPDLKESYIDKMINDEYRDGDILTIWYEDFADCMNNLDLDVLEEAEKKGYISKGEMSFNGTYKSWVNNFELKEYGYSTAYVTMKWIFPFHPDDIYNELEDIENYLDSMTVKEFQKRISEVKSQIKANETALKDIKEYTQKLNDIYCKGYDVTGDIIYHIEEDEEKKYKITPPPTTEQIYEYKKELIKEVLYKKTGNHYTNAISNPAGEYFSTKKHIEYAKDTKLRWTGSQSREEFIESETERYNIAKTRYDIFKPLNDITEAEKFAEEIRKHLTDKEIEEIINS